MRNCEGAISRVIHLVTHAMILKSSAAAAASGENVRFYRKPGNAAGWLNGRRYYSLLELASLSLSAAHQCELPRVAKKKKRDPPLTMTYTHYRHRSSEGLCSVCLVKKTHKINAVNELTTVRISA